MAAEATGGQKLDLQMHQGLISLVLVVTSFVVIRVAFDTKLATILPFHQPLIAATIAVSISGVLFSKGLFWSCALYGVWLCMPGWIVSTIVPMMLGDQHPKFLAWANVTSRQIYTFFAFEINPYLSLKTYREDPEEAFPSRYIATSNHQSNWDPWVVAAAFQRHDFGQPAYFVYKNSLDMLPVGGGCLPLAGNISVARNKATGDRIAALMELSRQRLFSNDKAMFCAFVEGTRSKSGEVQPFKHGYPRFALQHQVDVLPTLILNSAESWPAFSLLKMAKAEVKFVFGKVVKPPKCATPGEPTKEEVADFVKVLEQKTDALINIVPEAERPQWWGGPMPGYKPTPTEKKAQ